MFEVIWNIL